MRSPKLLHIYIIALKCTLILSLCSFVLPANAQVSDGVSEQALVSLTNFAEKVRSDPKLQNSVQNIQTLAPHWSLNESQKREHYAKYLEAYGPDYQSAIDALFALTEGEQSYYRVLAEQYNLFYQLKNLEVKSDAYAQSLDALRAYQLSENWHDANRALYLEASLQLNSDQHELALQKANAAIKLLPDSLDQDVSKAFLDTNEAVIAIYLYTANLELAAPALEQQLIRAKSLGIDYDGITHLNNIVYALVKWREFETANTISEIAYDLSQNSSTQRRITSAYRYAQTLNALGRYPEADRVARSGLELTEPGIWDIHLTSQRAVALAGFGSYSEAQNLLRKVEIELKDYPQFSPRFAIRLNQVQALLAREQADARKVFEIMDDALTIQTRTLLQQSSDETQKLMGTLDNEKALQAAQEAKIETERVLAVERAEAAARRARYLMIILGISVVALICAIAFAIHQRKAAKEFSRLRDMAASGEQAKSRFLAVMSHELRTPLNGIIGLAEMLSRNGPSKDVQFKGGVIYKSGLSLLDLLSNVLDMSQIEANKISIHQSAADMRDMMNNLKELWSYRANKKGLTLSVEIDDSLPRLLALDAVRVRQCLENLISNAIKFTAKGSVDIQVSYAPLSAKAQRKADRHGKVTVIIRDTGKGLTPSEQASVFKPFTQADNSTTRQFGGSGLGLAITHQLAVLMGGDVTVISEVGQGAEFTFTFTCSPDKAKQADSTPLIASTKEVLLRVENGLDEEIKAKSASAPKINAPAITPPDPQTQPQKQNALILDAPETLEEFNPAMSINTAPNRAAQPSPSHDTATQPAMQPLAQTVPPLKPQIADETPHMDVTKKSDVLNLSQVFTNMLNEIDQSCSLPASNTDNAIAAQTSPDPIPLKPESFDPLQNLKVLVVDDIEANHEVLKIFLQPAGCSVVTALNGREAVQAASCEKFDLILMDVRMPEMDGIQATQMIKRAGEANSETPIIAMTADISAQNNAQCMAAGANVFLTKPVVASELFGAIRYVLGTKAPALRKADFA